MLLPRAVIEQVGYLDETLFMYCEDVDYCIRFRPGPVCRCGSCPMPNCGIRQAAARCCRSTITRNTLYLTCKENRAYAKRKTVLPILTGAARYALTKALGRKKAAVMAPTVVPWTF